jgi:hypothetical protein
MYPMGMNLPSINYYTTAVPFIDLMRTATTQGGGTYVAAPEGKCEYRVSWKGQATQVRLRVGTRYNIAAGVNEVRIPLDVNDNPSTPVQVVGDVSGISIVQVEHIPLLAQGEIFHPEYLAALAPFPAVRFMDWSNANDAEPGNQRVEEAGKLAARAGLEVMRWHIHPTLTIPQAVAQVSTLLNLIPRDCRLEVAWGNEYWNAGLKTGAGIRSAATAMLSAADQKNGGKITQQTDWLYGTRLGQIGLALMPLDPRVRMVAEGQFVQPGRWAKVLEGYRSSGCPMWMLTALDTAPYFGIYDMSKDPGKPMANWIEWAKSGNVDAALDYMATVVADNIRFPEQHEAFAKQVGPWCRAGIYEHTGGPSVYTQAPWVPDAPAGLRDTVTAFTEKVCHSERASQLAMLNFYQCTMQGLTGRAYFFSLAGRGGKSGFWGARPSVHTDAVYSIWPKLVRYNGVAAGRA